MKKTTNKLFDVAYYGCDRNLRTTSSEKDNELIVQFTCNQKFSMDYVFEIINELRSDKNFMQSLHKQDLYNGCAIDFEHRNKKFDLSFMDANHFKEVILNQI